MLLKRQEKNNLIKAMYSSTNIIASIYNKETSDLTLIFNKGGQYKYPGVSNTDYTRFEIAESQGKVFNSHIKAYPFEKLADVDPSAIIKEVTSLKEAEDKALTEAKQMKLVGVMKSMLSTDEGKTIFTSTQLESLQTAIAECLTQLIPA